MLFSIRLTTLIIKVKQKSWILWELKQKYEVQLKSRPALNCGNRLQADYTRQGLKLEDIGQIDVEEIRIIKFVTAHECNQASK
jgi:hypothetical protein